jgi:hypothetical protein
MSIDPLAEKYNWMSCYQFASNQVIHGREIEGLENDNDLNYDDLDESYLNFYGGYRVYGIDLFDNNNEQIHTPNMDLNEVVVEDSRGTNYDNDEEFDDFTGFDNQDFGWDDGYDVVTGALGNYLFALDHYAQSNSSKVYNYGTRAVSAIALGEANTARMLNISKNAQVIGNTLGIVTGAYTLTKTIEKHVNTGVVDVKGYLDGSIGIIGGVAGTIVTFGLVSNPVGWGVLATAAAIYGIGSFVYDVYHLNEE